MNALYKILSLSACALLAFKLHTWPTHQAHVRAKVELAQMRSESLNAQRMLEFAQSLPRHPVHLHGPDRALSDALDAVHAQASNHGIKIAQVIASDVPITQQVFATASLRKEDAATSTLSQKLLVKGSYIDLLGLRRYLKEVLSVDKGLVIHDLSIKGDGVELGLSIHSAQADGPTTTHTSVAR